jgi:hypothetical protein
MRSKRLLILAALLLASPAAAQQRWQPEDHLEPEDSILGGTAFSSGYDTTLRDLLHDAYDLNVEVRMVALPSFFPEYAVGLRGLKTLGAGAFKTTARGAPYRIFVLSPSAQIWTYATIAMLNSGQERVVGDKNNEARDKQLAQLQSKVPANPHDMKINRCEADISDALGGRIIALWGKVLLSTRYSAQYPGGADGVTYHLAAFVPRRGMLAGQAWSPDRNSVTGTLVTLADTMRAVCEKKASEADLEKLATELEQRLQKETGK